MSPPLDSNFYGMIDQLVASRGTRFLYVSSRTVISDFVPTVQKEISLLLFLYCSGCYHSTFTGFIMRMRGYHASNHKEDGYEDGRLPNSFYYVPLQHKKTMDTYAAIHGAFFNREFPTSWRDLDASVGDVPGATTADQGAAAVAVAVARQFGAV
jgi:hypothetical protein